MSECPKCGRNDILGPIYERSSDRLRYHCRVCGYSMTTATRDHMGSDEAGEIMERMRRAMETRR